MALLDLSPRYWQARLGIYVSCIVLSMFRYRIVNSFVKTALEKNYGQNLNSSIINELTVDPNLKTP